MPGDGHGRGALVAHAHMQGAEPPQQQRGLERAQDRRRAWCAGARHVQARARLARTRWRRRPHRNGRSGIWWRNAARGRRRARAAGVSTGVGTVESTASRAPAACAMRAASAMSVMVHSGLEGVSIQTSRVRPGRMAARSARGIAGIDEGRLDAVARRILDQPVAQAPVHGRGRDHMSGPLQRQEGGGGGRHAGREQQARRALFQLRSGRARPGARWRCRSGRSSSRGDIGCRRSRTKVVATWIGGTMAPVPASTAPPACAAMVSGARSLSSASPRGSQFRRQHSPRCTHCAVLRSPANSRRAFSTQPARRKTIQSARNTCSSSAWTWTRTRKRSSTRSTTPSTCPSSSRCRVCVAPRAWRARTSPTASAACRRRRSMRLRATPPSTRSIAPRCSSAPVGEASGGRPLAGAGAPLYPQSQPRHLQGAMTSSSPSPASHGERDLRIRRVRRPCPCQYGSRRRRLKISRSPPGVDRGRPRCAGTL